MDGGKRLTVNDDCSSATLILPLCDQAPTQFPNGIEDALLNRTLKIEVAGDFWKGGIKPKIRLMGQWLERAGFQPGNRVSVTCLSPGIIELRAAAASLLNDLPK